MSNAHYNSLKRIERRILLEELGAAEQRAADGESGEAGRGEEGQGEIFRGVRLSLFVYFNYETN